MFLQKKTRKAGEKRLAHLTEGKIILDEKAKKGGRDFIRWGQSIPRPGRDGKGKKITNLQ